jgi:hemerythrin-like domain-containing protein
MMGGALVVFNPPRLGGRIMKPQRRDFLLATTTLGLAGVAQAIAEAEPAGKKKTKGTSASKAVESKAAEAEVSAPEDLMREHGVLRRILLVYEEALRQMAAGKEIVPDVLHQSATLVRKFVEDYHEQLEEKYIFPLLVKRERLVPLVKTLIKQHDAGRAMTSVILAYTTAKSVESKLARGKLAKAVELFVRMYGPHAAWEDTVVFPALHELLSNKEMDALGDQFEAEENRRFGDRGFEKTVEQVAGIEKEIGIFDLEKVTPPAAEIGAFKGMCG